MTIAIAFGLVLLLIIAGALLLSRLAEREAWNGGNCSHCGGRWQSFDTDSTGARGYICQCNRRIWIGGSADKARR